MVKASELRVGNLYMHCSTVDDFKEHMIAKDLDDDWNPIPLTPEWLERMGFKDGWLDFNKGCQLKVHLTDGTATAGGWDSATSGQSVEVPCKYVHQLQNLFYCLTGEELQITSHE